MMRNQAQTFRLPEIRDKRPKVATLLLNQNKFYPDGRPRPYAGNTIICHLPQQGEQSSFFNVLLDMYRDVLAQGFSGKLALLPPSSYHMTVLDGLNDGLRTRPSWPEALARTAPMPSCDQWVKDRLGTFHYGLDLPIRMRPARPDPSYDGKIPHIRLEPADHVQERMLAGLRHALAAHMGMKEPRPGSYVFHTTLAYQVRSFADHEAAEFTRFMMQWQDVMNRTMPEIRLGAPELCFFSDMYAYHRQFFIT
ncbi:DUF1868 domain-containing protein [Komagataeibacter sp. FNDCR1]|nr:DUF1868 domain-containing protein [Komagataeibacter sp. FNDCR1]